MWMASINVLRTIIRHFFDGTCCRWGDVKCSDEGYDTLRYLFFFCSCLNLIDAPFFCRRENHLSQATLKDLWSPDAAGGDYRDEMAVATYAVQVASTVARELQEELCQKGAIR